jgi:hypothetical protein
MLTVLPVSREIQHAATPVVTDALNTLRSRTMNNVLAHS